MSEFREGLKDSIKMHIIKPIRVIESDSHNVQEKLN